MFEKEKVHSAMKDIRESVEELKITQEQFFREKQVFCMKNGYFSYVFVKNRYIAHDVRQTFAVTGLF